MDSINSPKLHVLRESVLHQPKTFEGELETNDYLFLAQIEDCASLDGLLATDQVSLVKVVAYLVTQAKWKLQEKSCFAQLGKDSHQCDLKYEINS